MRCSSYCTASSYNIHQLLDFLNENGLEPKHFDDVIYIQKKFNSLGERQSIDIFLFPFGCVTIWGGSEIEEKSIIEMFYNFELDKMNSPSQDVIYFNFDENSTKTFIDEEKNQIILHDNSVFIKLSISHALAQSVKLNILEKSVSNLITQTTPIQQELAKKGSVSLSKREISKQIGILFNERYSINLHSDILDTPEFFWRRPSYEPLYLTTAQFQDIKIRQDILNHRLDMIHELYNILSNELNYKHSTRLEIIVIILITSEVMIGLYHNDIFKTIFSWF